jgi:hypothetical protein
MLNRKKQLKRTHYLSAGLIFVLLLVAIPVAAQASGVGGGSISGDDAYDPAAGGLPAVAVAAVPQRIVPSGATTLSGDDAYDPAAGGLPALAVAGIVRSAGPEIACAPSDSELEARRARAVDGGFSGDDAYDPAAGGIPELSLLAAGLDLVACVPVASGG